MTNPHLSRRCPVCEVELPANSEHERCSDCTVPSMGSNIWSFFAPASSTSDKLWRRRAAIAFYFAIPGWVVAAAAVGRFSGGGLKNNTGALFVATLFFAMAAMGVAFMLPRILPEDGPRRTTVGIIAALCVLPVWGLVAWVLYQAFIAS